MTATSPHAERLGWHDAEPPISQGHYRSTYEALRRSDHELAVTGRRYWANALAQYESIRPKDVNDVVGRFRSDDHRHHVGACLEMTSAILLPKLSLALSAPVNGNPDFEGVLDGLPLTVECTAVTALDAHANAMSLQTEVICEAIKTLRIAGLTFKIRISGECTHRPSIRKIQELITRWVEAHPALRDAPVGLLSNLCIEPLAVEVHGARVQIEPLYRSDNPGRSAFGMLTGDGCFVGPITDAVAKAIRDKASKYRPQPLLLVLGVSSAFGSIDEIIDGMLGPARHTVPRDSAPGVAIDVSGEQDIRDRIFDREFTSQHVVGVLAIVRHLNLPWLATMALLPNPFTSFTSQGAAFERILVNHFGAGDVHDLIQRQLMDDRPLRAHLSDSI